MPPPMDFEKYLPTFKSIVTLEKPMFTECDDNKKAQFICIKRNFNESDHGHDRDHENDLE